MIESCKRQALADIKRLDEQMRNRLEWSDLDFLRSVLVFLDTQSWDNSDDDKSEIQAALTCIIEVFCPPLEAKGVDLSSIIDELTEAIEHVNTYLRYREESYRKIWYQLYTSPDAV